MERKKYRISYSTRFNQEISMIWKVFASSEQSALERFRRHCRKHAIDCENVEININ
jgi:hypothetical protein